MATPTTVDFSTTRDDLINAALRLVGALDPEGGTPTATQLSNGAEALNMMVKAWTSKGLRLWKRKTISISLVASTATYTLGSTTSTTRPLRIHDGYIRVSDNDTPIRIISREEYNKLGNKTSEGTPTQLWYDPQLTNATVTVYPVPSVAATLYLEVEYPINDFDAGSDVPDLPQEWYEALKFNLAVRLAPEYGVDKTKFSILNGFAIQTLADADAFDQEWTSIYFGIDYNG